MRQKYILTFTWIFWTFAAASLWIKGFNSLTAEMAFSVAFVSVIIGTLKYLLVIRRASDRLINHIRSQNEPIPFKKIYPPRIYPIMALMVVIGPIIKHIGLPSNIKALIDLTVGIALFNGASDFLKEAAFPKKIIFK